MKKPIGILGFIFILFISVTVAQTPNDPSYGQQRYLHNTGGVYNGYTGTADADIDAPEAWAYSDIDNLSGGTVTVAIIGYLGFDYNDPELTGRLRDGSTCLDFDGSALGGCVYGWDYDGPPYDPYLVGIAHDHRVASIISAVKDNNLDVVGVAPNTEIMYIVGPSSNPITSQTVDFARYNEADIIVLVYDYSDIDSTAKTALEDFSSSGGLVVAAALNNGNLQENDADLHEYVSNLIIVGGSDQNDEPMDNSHINSLVSSNYSTSAVHIAAPSVDILTDTPEATNDSRFRYGNSFSAPIVAGVAALARGVRPNLSAHSLKQAIIRNGDVIAALSGQTIYGSRVNAYNTLVALGGIPDSFDFSDIGYANPSSYHTQQLTIAGLSGTSWVYTVGGEYRIDLSGAYMTGVSSISNGDIIEIRLQAPSDYNDSGSMTVYIGTGSSTITDTISVYSHDTIPEGFSSSSKNGDISEEILSETTTIGTITTGVQISVDAGSYSINNGTFTSDTGTVNNGDTVVFKLTASDNPGKTTTMNITIGASTGSFSVNAIRNGDREYLTPNNGFTDGTYSCTTTGSDYYGTGNIFDIVYTGNTIYVSCTSHDSGSALLLFSYDTNSDTVTHLNTIVTTGNDDFSRALQLILYGNNPVVGTNINDNPGGNYRPDPFIAIYSGSTIILSGGGIIGNSSYFLSSIISYNNNIFLYSDDDTPNSLRIYDGSSWEESFYFLDYINSTLFTLDNTLYGAIKNNTTLKISHYPGEIEEVLINKSISTDFGFSLAKQHASDNMYILVYSGTSNETGNTTKLTVYRFDGTTLSTIGDTGFYTTNTLIHERNGENFFVDSNDNIYIPTLDGSTNKPVILTYINGEWRNINAPLSSSHIRQNTETQKYKRSFKVTVIDDNLYFFGQSPIASNDIEVWKLNIDGTPADFSASSQSNLELGASIDIASLTVSGITVPVYVTSTNAEVSINDGAYSAATGVVENGNTVSIRATTPTKQATDTAVSISIGDLIKSLTLRTRVGGGGGGSSGGGGGSSSSSASSTQNIKSSISTTTETKTFANKSFDTTRISYTKNNYTVSFFLPDYSSFSDTIQEFVYDRLSPAMVNVLSKVSTTKQEAIIAAYQDVVYALYIGAIHSELKDTIDLTIENLIDILLNL